MAKFSERLKELRLEKGVSQTAVSKATGLSQNAIAQWESEKRIPNANAVIILAKYFEVTVGYLLGTEN